jgi:hypothetical protein
MYCTVQYAQILSSFALAVSLPHVTTNYIYYVSRQRRQWRTHGFRLERERPRCDDMMYAASLEYPFLSLLNSIHHTT